MPFPAFLRSVRPGLGDGARAIELAAAAARRRRGNWALPGLLALAIAVACAAMAMSDAVGNFAYPAFRVIAIDYLVFVFGWFAAWNSASRWRSGGAALEDLTLTTLRPAVVGHLLFAGALSVWGRLLALVAVVDVAFVAAQLYAAKFSPGLTVAALCAQVLFAAGLAVFHLRTMELAYWMFAVAALPRTVLRRMAIANFFAIPVYVAILTVVGSMLAGACLLPLMLMGSAMTIPATEEMAWLAVGWSVAAVPAMMLVGLLKRQLALSYEQSFARAYLFYQWWGAGESEHPSSYPVAWEQEVHRWLNAYAAEERRERSRPR